MEAWTYKLWDAAVPRALGKRLDDLVQSWAEDWGMAWHTPRAACWPACEVSSQLSTAAAAGWRSLGPGLWCALSDALATHIAPDLLLTDHAEEGNPPVVLGRAVVTASIDALLEAVCRAIVSGAPAVPRDAEWGATPAAWATRRGSGWCGVVIAIGETARVHLLIAPERVSAFAATSLHLDTERLPAVPLQTAARSGAMRLSVLLGDAVAGAGALWQLHVGDVLRIDQRTDQPLTALLGPAEDDDLQPFCGAALGQRDGALCIRLLKTASTRHPVHP